MDEGKKEKQGVLLISDIHYSDDKNMSMFQKYNENNYYDIWVNCVHDLKEKENVSVKYLVILGDVVENGNRKQYEVMCGYLRKFCDEFEIENDNILLIPGNHDVGRARLETYCEENNISDDDASDCFDIKLKSFCDFYNDLLERELSPDKAILSKIYIEEEDVWLLGLNSLVKESHRDHKGYIDIDKLRDELEKFDVKKKTVYVASHHSFSATGMGEPASIENISPLMGLLKSEGINTYIYGHHHASSNAMKQENDEELPSRFIEIGSFGRALSGSYNNYFFLLVCEEGYFKLLSYMFHQEKWIPTSQDVPLSIISVRTSKEDGDDKPVSLPMITTEDGDNLEDNIEDASLSENTKDNVLLYDSSDYLMSYLREGKNYRTGHYHWRNKEKIQKTLGWIDIASFLGNIDILEEIKDSMICMLDKYATDLQVAVGYGMEGNIMGSVLQGYWHEKNISYYYYPSLHKLHTKSEKKLWSMFVEEERLLLIFDIMPPNDYLEEIIETINSSGKCTRIYVISLFLNENLLKNPSNIESGIEVVRMALAKVNVDVCEKDLNECVVCQQRLEKVYEL